MELYPAFHISPKLLEAAQRAEELARPQFAEIESIQRYNQQKMLAAFSKAGVSESHFVGSTGYGYGDRGRDVLDQVYAYAFGAEDALVRHNFVSGTHTLTVALFGVLRPGDKMLCVTGTPYDTIQGVIGLEGREEPGSLKEFGIHYEELPLRPDGTPDLEAMERRITPEYKMIYIQRSRGYSLRPSLRVEDIAPIVEISKRKAPDAIVMVDNCYGEFVEREEPLAVGADIIAGSLIKNPGGGIAPTGGYIAGRRDLVELCSYRLTTPGTGREIGCTLGNNRELFMGAFHAPRSRRGLENRRVRFGAVLPAGFRRHPRRGGEARGHHPGDAPGKAGEPHRLLQRRAEGRAGGFLCGARAQRHARLRQPGDYGRWRFYPGLLHRALRRRPPPGALRRLDARGPQLPQRPAGHAFGRPGDAPRGPHCAVSLFSQ